MHQVPYRALYLFFMYRSITESTSSLHFWQGALAILLLLGLIYVVLIGIYETPIMNSRWKFLVNPDSLILNILVIVWLAQLSFTGMILCMKVAEAHAQTWLAPELKYLYHSSRHHLAISCSFCTDLYKRMDGQFQEARQGALLHLEITVYYYSRYFMAVTMAAILGIFAGIFLVFITNNGWSQTKWLVRSIFIFSTVCAAFFSAMPSFFEQEDNIDKNKDLYVSYKGLHKNLLSFSANCVSIQCDSVNLYINKVDTKLLELGKFPLKFNRSAIDFSKTIQSLSSTASPGIGK